MSASVRISLESARGLMGVCNLFGVSNRFVRELEAAIAKVKRLSEKRRPALKAKAAKKKTRKEETAEIRAAVMSRAGGFCECGCGTGFSPNNQPEMDHFFPKAREPQSVETCWALTRACHRRKTNNEPSWEHWRERFVAHAQRHGYRYAANKARLAIAYARTRSELSRRAGT